MKNLIRFAFCFSLLLFLTNITVAQDQLFAQLGDFKLENGETIRDCRIGYRTFGKLNDHKSNAVLFPTWASGTTEQAKSNIGPGKLIDTTKYYVIDVSDSFGGSIERAAAAVKAKVLVIVAKTDHVVTPGPALDFAQLLHSKALELKSDCGHLAPSCEVQTVSQAVADFLEQ